MLSEVEWRIASIKEQGISGTEDALWNLKTELSKVGTRLGIWTKTSAATRGLLNPLVAAS